MNQHNLESVDLPEFTPIPMNQSLQPMQPVQQQQPQKRLLDCSDQNPVDAAKRQRLDNTNFQSNFPQQMQPMQPSMQQIQFPQTPQSQPQNMQQQQQLMMSPFSPFPANYNFYPQSFPMQPMQQLQPQMPQPSFPITSTPIRSNGGNFTPYYPLTPMGGLNMTPFFPTPPSDGSVPSFPGTMMAPMGVAQTPTHVPHQIADDDVLFKKEGILSGLSLEGGNKAKVTIGELRRRIDAPEFLDANQLSRLTRYPKSSFREFQRTFTSHGFKARVNEGQSKTNRVISYLLEAESITLAKDFNKLVSTELPIASLAALIVNRTPHVREQAEAIRDHLSYVRTFLLSGGREPKEMERIEKGGGLVDPMLKQFSLSTHGFGPLAVVSVIESLAQLMTVIEKSCPSDAVIKSALSPLPHLVQVSNSFNNSFNASFSSSFNDSGFQSTPKTTPTSATPQSKRASSSDVDLSLLSVFPNDGIIYNDSIPPRIAYDAEPLQVTIGELRRRAYGPEKFTVSLMNSYLRKGKKVNTHNNLRDDLCRYGIEMKPSKGLKPTSWSSMTETEATYLSADVVNCLGYLPPSQELRKHFKNNSHTTNWLKFIAGTVREGMCRIQLDPIQSKVETQADVDLMRFALITHHFGNSFYASVMQWLQNLG